MQKKEEKEKRKVNYLFAVEKFHKSIQIVLKCSKKGQIALFIKSSKSTSWNSPADICWPWTLDQYTILSPISYPWHLAVTCHNLRPSLMHCHPPTPPPLRLKLRKSGYPEIPQKFGRLKEILDSILQFYNFFSCKDFFSSVKPTLCDFVQNIARIANAVQCHN